MKSRVSASFGATAENFVKSATHASGEDLRRMVELASPRGDERVLDVATGGGHTALAFAPRVREVVASDLTPQMLEAAENLIREKGVHNVRFERADAEELPFESGSFAIVTCRIAAHHFPEPRKFVSEAARVLGPGGLFLLDDNAAPEEPALDEFMNRFEKWRDPEHVRAHRVSEWRGWMEEAGLRVEHAETHRKTYEFEEWAERIGTPERERRSLEEWLLLAEPEFKSFFGMVEAQGRLVSLESTFAIIAARRA